jgi:hypothetical protein
MKRCQLFGCENWQKIQAGTEFFRKSPKFPDPAPAAFAESCSNTCSGGPEGPGGECAQLPPVHRDAE